MIKKQHIWLIPIMMLMLVPAIQVKAESSQSVHSTTVLNIREGPSLEDPIIGKTESGTSYKVLADNGDWVEIDIGNGQAGWVAAYLVTKSETSSSEDDNSQTDSITATKGTISENGVRMRKGPGTNYQVITTLSINMPVTILSNEGNWTKIHSESGTGWVNSQYVVDENQDTAEATEVSSADSQTAIVAEDDINVRDTASLNGEVIGKLAKGTVIHIVGENGDWAKIQFSGNTGWVYQNLLESGSEVEKGSKKSIDTSITILHDGTNIRSEASVHASVLSIAGEGDSYKATEEVGDWYKIELTDGQVGYVASWIVTESAEKQPAAASTQDSGEKGDLKGKTIVIDPGHGGKDSGTIGAVGTLEKTLTIRTANLLAEKLQAAGSKVVFTRQNDVFITLQDRVNMSSFYKADAFISIHYDSIKDSNVRGMTSYYYSSSQKELANVLHESIIEATQMKDRGVRKNDYFVLRENTQPATLLELGYLSNQQEEGLVSSQKYQETVSAAIYEGLENYFQ